MYRLKAVSARRLIQKLKRAGFSETHQRGSHLYLRCEDKIVTVPIHGGKDIPIGTLRNIVIHQARLDIREFNRL